MPIQDATQDLDPYCLHVVIKHDAFNTHENVIASSIHAFAVYVEQLLTTSDPEAIETFLQWSTPDMRKVVRRAKGNHWNRVLNKTGLLYSFDKNVPEVIVLDPTRVSLTPAEVKKLQVAGTDYPHQERNKLALSDVSLHINPTLGLSTGKAVAQALHAMHRLTLAVFFQDKVTNDVIGFDPKLVAQLKHKPLREWRVQIQENVIDEWDFMVVDSGFTEIDAGSVTVLARVY